MRSEDPAGTAGSRGPGVNPDSLQIRSQMKLLSWIFIDTFSLFLLFLSYFSVQPRNIAKVVSQVHAFQEVAFPYNHDRPLQAYIRWRISQLSALDVHLLAPDSDSHLQQSSESQTRKIQEKLMRMKASFHWGPYPVTAQTPVSARRHNQARTQTTVQAKANLQMPLFQWQPNCCWMSSFTFIN